MIDQTPTALKSALEMLGFFNVYHGEDAFYLNPRDCEMWMEALDAKFYGKGKKYSRKEFDQLLGHCQVCFFPSTRDPSRYFDCSG